MLATREDVGGARREYGIEVGQSRVTCHACPSGHHSTEGAKQIGCQNCVSGSL
jgi:hypothetical protein